MGTLVYRGGTRGQARLLVADLVVHGFAARLLRPRMSVWYVAVEEDRPDLAQTIARTCPGAPPPLS